MKVRKWRGCRHLHVRLGCFRGSQRIGVAPGSIGKEGMARVVLDGYGKGKEGDIGALREDA